MAILTQGGTALRVRSLAKGMISFLPGLSGLAMPSGRAGGHTASAQYCYSVWLKHMTLLAEQGLLSPPSTVAELGPGSSIGVGLAALLSGADHYVSLDVVPYTSDARNLAVLEDLLVLFRSRASRPDKGWPDFDGPLDDRLFPSHILTPAVLQRTLAPQRIAELRNAVNRISESGGGSISIRHVAPWSDAAVVRDNSVDLIISHSVLEHVTDLEATYSALYRWLRPSGWMSHQIDFRSHGLSAKWNGYRACSELTWKMLMGRRPYLINREPCSTHLDHIRRTGFEIVCELKHMRADGVKRSQLTSHWAHLSDEDLNCSGLFVQARKLALH